MKQTGNSKLSKLKIEFLAQKGAPKWILACGVVLLEYIFSLSYLRMFKLASGTLHQGQKSQFVKCKLRTLNIKFASNTIQLGYFGI